jgi:hypothetical protein
VCQGRGARFNGLFAFGVIFCGAGRNLGAQVLGAQVVAECLHDHDPEAEPLYCMARFLLRGEIAVVDYF